MVCPKDGATNYFRIDTGGAITVSSITNFTNTTSATTSLLGAVVIGNGTATTSVGIGAGNINAGGSINVGSSISTPISGFVCLGDVSTDGSWRFAIVGGNLCVQKRVSGVYLTYHEFG
jgi:hypothetical protein